jgi:glycolate oxidase
MSFNRISKDILAEIIEIIGTDNVFTDPVKLEKYAQDETEDLIFFPEVVVRPNTKEQISQLFQLCNRSMIPVTPRGAGTGLSGGALAVMGGLLLSKSQRI